jgi:hypothetical protein
MDFHKVVAGSVLAAGLGVAGMMGAGTASAGPGIAYSDGDGGVQDFNFGDAKASVGTGSQGLAISVLGRASATEEDKASGNRLLAIDGVALANGNATGNTVVGFAVGEATAGDNSSGNTVVAVFDSKATVGGDISGELVAAGCGGTVTVTNAQAQRIENRCFGVNPL